MSNKKQYRLVWLNEETEKQGGVGDSFPEHYKPWFEHLRDKMSKLSPHIKYEVVQCD